MTTMTVCKVESLSAELSAETDAALKAAGLGLTVSPLPTKFHRYQERPGGWYVHGQRVEVRAPGGASLAVEQLDSHMRVRFATPAAVLAAALRPSHWSAEEKAAAQAALRTALGEDLAERLVRASEA